MTNTVRLLAGSAVLLALASCGKSGDNSNAAGANAAVASTGNATGSTTAAAPGASAAPVAAAVDPNEKRMVIEALPVAQAGPGAIVGKMHMVRSAGGIETDGIGGGCMVIKDPASKVCHADRDCQVPSYISRAGGPWAYCAESKCWIKPADKAFCWKSRYSTPPTPFQVGKPQSTPEVKLASLPAQLLQGSARNQVRARVIACLNGKFTGAPPCGGGPGDVVHDIGPIRTLTKK